MELNGINDGLMGFNDGLIQPIASKWCFFFLDLMEPNSLFWYEKDMIW